MGGRRRVDGNRTASLRADSTDHGGQGPLRTCIGCRQRVTAAELFRVVVAREPGGEPAPVVPDPHRRMPGRGAWLHPDPACVELAVRRRAFGRALRASGALDPSPVADHVARLALQNQ